MKKKGQVLDLLLENPEARKIAGSEDIVFFARYYLDHHVQTKVSDLHKEWITALTEYQRMAIAAPRGHAKAQALDSKVLTPTGWTTIGELQVGDKVIGEDGKPKKIKYLHPISQMDLYRISTRDGRSALCNLDHLWGVQCPSNTGYKNVLKSTSDILQNYKSNRVDNRTGKRYTEYRYFLPTLEPVQFSLKKLPIDPYTLGVWLGDGTSANGNITTADPEILDYIPYKHTKQKAIYRYNLCGLRTELCVNNLLNNKHIPEIYLFSSIGQRVRLLQGLIDTDGTISTDGMQIAFSNKNKYIIDGVIDLIRSLGGTATLGDNITRFDKHSEYKYSYRITARLPESIIPVRLSRKREKWNGSIKTKTAIVNISYERTDFGRCITVEDDYYITNDYMVTHNSTWINLVYILWCILYKKKKFIVMISDSMQQATEFLGAIMEELETNEKIIKDFGKIAGYTPPKAEEKKKWTTQEIVTLTDIKVIARSWNSRIRGIRYKEQRPDLIILDDIENDENVQSEDQRNKVKNIFNKSILNLGAKETQLIVVGTILHFDSLLMNLIDKPREGWYTKLYRAIKDDGTPLWPEWWSLESLDQKKADIGSIPFQQEFMNNPLDPSQQILKPCAFYDDIDLSMLECFGYIDLAISEKQTADYTAIGTIGRHKITGKLYVLEPVRIRGDISKQRDLVFLQHSKYNYKIFGVESVAYQKAFYQIMIEESRKRNIYIPLKEIEVDKDKIRRAIEVSPHIENGTVLFNAGYQDFMAEVVQFPKAAHDDFVDSLVGAIKIALQGGGKSQTLKRHGRPAYPKNY